MRNRIRNSFLLLVLLALPGLQAGTVVQFRTVLGDVEVELYDVDKPITSANFIRYVADGAYQDTIFHRVVPDFVIQGGGYRTFSRGTPNAGVVGVSTRQPIVNEFAVGPFLSNVAGTIAMAKTSDPNSATSQFFFNIRTNVALDSPANSGGFTVFGRIIKGSDTLEAWNNFTPFNIQTTPNTATNLIVNVGTPGLNELPVLKLSLNGDGSRFIHISDLLYIDITLLKVQVRHRQDGGAEIQWQPVAGRTNYVEYTDVFPPEWQPLTHLAPEQIPTPVYDGPPLPADDAPKNYPSVVIDPSAQPNRFYRVRATY